MLITPADLHEVGTGPGAFTVADGWVTPGNKSCQVYINRNLQMNLCSRILGISTTGLWDFLSIALTVCSKSYVPLVKSELRHDELTLTAMLMLSSEFE